METNTKSIEDIVLDLFNRLDDDKKTYFISYLRFLNNQNQIIQNYHSAD